MPVLKEKTTYEVCEGMHQFGNGARMEVANLVGDKTRLVISGYWFDPEALRELSELTAKMADVMEGK